MNENYKIAPEMGKRVERTEDKTKKASTFLQKEHLKWKGV